MSNTPEGPGSMPSAALKQTNKNKQKQTKNPNKQTDIMVVHICNSSNWGREPGGSEVHPRIHSSFKVRQFNDQNKSTSSGWAVNLYGRWGHGKICFDLQLSHRLVLPLSVPPLLSSLLHLSHHCSLPVSLPDSRLSEPPHKGQMISPPTLCPRLPPCLQTMDGSLSPHLLMARVC